MPESPVLALRYEQGGSGATAESKLISLCGASIVQPVGTNRLTVSIHSGAILIGQQQGCEDPEPDGVFEHYLRPGR